MRAFRCRNDSVITWLSIFCIGISAYNRFNMSIAKKKTKNSHPYRKNEEYKLII